MMRAQTPAQAGNSLEDQPAPKRLRLGSLRSARHDIPTSMNSVDTDKHGHTQASTGIHTRARAYSDGRKRP